MLRVSYRLPALAVGLFLLACAQPPQLTPDAPTPAGTTPSPGAPATVTPPPPVSPSPPPTSLPPSLSPSPMESPTDTPGAIGARYLADFPTADSFGVAGLTATGDGFLAVGAEPAPGEDIDGIRQGVLWSSADGLAWERHSPVEFHGVSLDHAVLFDDELYLFGEASSCPPFDDECVPAANDGNAGWRGSLAGGWTRLTLPGTMRDASVDGVQVVAGQLAIHGSAGDEGEAALWLSADGRSWEAVSDLGGMDFVSTLADGPPGIVALGTHYDFATDSIETRAAYGAAGAALAPASVPAGLAVSVTGAGRGAAGIVAVGNTVPADDPGSGGVVLLSPDGTNWQLGPDDPFDGAGTAGLLELEGGVVAFAHTYVPGPELLIGQAWFSPDGTDWHSLGALEGGMYDELVGAAVGPAGVVVFAVEFAEERSIVHGWLIAPGNLERL